MRDRAVAVLVLAIAVAAASLMWPDRHVHEADAALPGANGLIAFDSYVGGKIGVFSMNADGTNVRPLATGFFDNEEPAWSPDGRQVAFTTSRETNHRFQIYVMNADGSNPHRVSLGFGNAASPSWSPDGTMIAFDSDVTGNSQVNVVRVDGSAQWVLTPIGGFNGFPAWSPDGTKIAFESDRSGTYDIWVMNSDGSAPVDLTRGNPAPAGTPNWSPDGSSIVFRGGASGIDVVDVETGAVRQVVTGATSIFPAWSADGSQISFSDSGTLYVVNADGSNRRSLAGRGQPVSSSWQPVSCVVQQVLDGQSFSCADGRTVLLRGVVAPAGGDCGAGWAAAALAYVFLPVGRTVRLQYGTPTSRGGYDIAAPLWRGDDGAEYNLSVVMVYVGLAQAVDGSSAFDRWLQAAQTWAQTAQWNMWAPGGPFNGATSC